MMMTPILPQTSLPESSVTSQEIGLFGSKDKQLVKFMPNAYAEACARAKAQGPEAMEKFLGKVSLALS
jgi:hypothetical protein